MGRAYHDRFALVLDYVTGPPNLIAAAEAQEHEFISWIYRFLGAGRDHRRGLSFRRHGCECQINAEKERLECQRTRR